MVIDWDDPTVQAILACPDGSQAWKMLDTYLKPVRDEIFESGGRSGRSVAAGGRPAKGRGRKSCLRRRWRKLDVCGKISRWRKR